MTTRKNATTAPTPAPEPSKPEMVTVYVVRRGVGDGVHVLPPSNPTPDSRSILTEVTVKPGELLPDWVDIAKAEHFVKMGLCEKVTLPRHRPDRPARIRPTDPEKVNTP